MPEPINGTITINIDEKYMHASVIITEPRYGGYPVSYEQLCKEIALKGVRYNIDEKAVREIIEKKIYDRSTIIAKGDMPVDGTNGTIAYRFEQTETPDLEEDEFGNVDFRNLGLIKNIEEGTVIADIYPETPGTPGTDVRGKRVAQYEGKPANFIVGQGVVLSEDGKMLYAKISGNLRWNKNHFVVDKEVVIGGDIDASVGNVDFIGSVTVKGDVKEGYFIKSGGSINVKGTVTGANITAIGDVTIGNGAVRSEVEGLNITANFFEGTKLTAHANLTAHSFVSCDVYCVGALTAKGGRGAIVGGKVTCLSNIEANVVGSESFTHTSIVLGNAAVLVEERIELVKKEEDLIVQLDQLGKICDMLQLQKKEAPLSEEREEMLTASIRGKFIHRGEIKKIRQRIREIEDELTSTNDLAVIVRKGIYPGVTVRIAYTQYSVDQIYGKCAVRMNRSGEIQVS